MAKVKLTSAFCRDVTCPPNKRKFVYRCTEFTGFGIEVRQSGKTYYHYYTKPNGKAAQLKIGGVGDITFDDARRRSKELRSRLVLGGNPAADKASRKAMLTFADLSDMHVEHAQNTLRSHACVEMTHRLYLKPRFGKLPLDQITPQEIERFLAELGKTHAPASVDRTRLVMNRAYTLGRSWKVPGAESNPVAAVARPRYDNKRTCLLSPAEVERLLEACAKSANPLLKPIVQLLLATAARKRELLNARVEHIDFERSVWQIPMTKNGRSRYVPLSKAAMAVINELPRYDGCPWLLPNPKTLKPFDNFKRAWATACKEAGLPNLVPHSLRHAAIGALVSQNVSLLVAGKIAGHLRPESTARYAHLADKTLAAAVEAGASSLGLSEVAE
ncbi:tyrosine-type recombinase/integrase [Altererythrobacter sp. BO-6]|uniref:tyrosine-type recombinase/integrase n=1 Tax=Altererythrobacter sp. BO-6 TaxID=2604537 RepID=UPI0013E1F742|nr:site-specific integrase [Altererythrobacter sp. BO-6]QIG53756.1 tyrosine-type recombinase/integrase [Altererythrobacter sp. BO-6]